MTRWTGRPVVFVDTHADVDALIAALVEATAELIYLRQFGKDGGLGRMPMERTRMRRARRRCMDLRRQL